MPYETPVLLGRVNGVIFDHENIMSYLLKYKNDPVSGEERTIKDIIKLNMTKNTDDEWECPITNKTFTDSTHIVAIATTGNVYSYNAVQELNLKSKNYHDLISGEKFTKHDIITLQDPQNLEHLRRRDINNFIHLKAIRQDSMNARSQSSSMSNIQSLQTADTMKELEAKRMVDNSNGVKRKTTEEILMKKDMSYVLDIKEIYELKPLIIDVNPGQVNTDGLASSALTSTSFNLNTSNATRLASPEEIRDAKWKIMRKLGKKGYVQLQTSLGNLNLEIHCDICPRTAWNFMTLCLREYYDNMTFHRLVPGFMIQSGDPTGTGTGGESSFGSEPFKDEFDNRLLHSGRGILSMANSGCNTNGSQFFILFKEAKHLDLKHSVFGRVVGGLSNLDKMEEIRSDKKEKPLCDIRIHKAVVFTNPIIEAEAILKQTITQNMMKRIKTVKTSVIGGSSSSSSSSSVSHELRQDDDAGAMKKARKLN